MDKPTTKKCPKCSNEKLVLLRTLNKKACMDCNTVFPWFLEKGQKPIK